MKKSSRHTAKSASILLYVAATFTGWGVTGTLSAQSDDYNTEITIAEIMDAIVMREADIVWQSVRFESTEDGYEMVGPETDEEWLEVRHAALALAEVTNNLLIPGRHANTPDATVGEGELSPAEIDAAIKQKRSAWVGFARTLRATAMETVEAIDERDLDKILDIGGTIDENCESCHLVFWYPNQ
jgi:hypothetical protein